MTDVLDRPLAQAKVVGADATLRADREGDALKEPQFDVAYEEGGLYLLTMHPHMMGHRSRAALLERLIQYIKKKPGRDAIDWTMLEAVIKENPELYGKLKYKSAAA